MPSHAGPNLITDGLVVHLDAKDRNSYTSGDTWYDLSGKNNHCVFDVTPTHNGTHFTFDGATTWGDILNNATLDFANEQTIIMVLRHTYTSGRTNPWNQAYGGYGTWTHEHGNAINYFFGDAGVDNVPYTNILSAGTSTSVWNVLGITRNTTTARWFLNGAMSGEITHYYGPLAATAANISIGYGYAGFWPGDMALVMAYTRQLSIAEVNTHYEQYKTRFGL